MTKQRNRYKMIAACGENNELGDGKDLLWHLPKDMAFFKKKTWGTDVIMGRKTYESFPEKYRPLPHRRNIVISRSKKLPLPENVHLCHSLDEAFSVAQQNSETEKFVIGGGSIYEQSIQYVDVIYLTRVHSTFSNASVFFPVLNESDWKETWREDHHKDEKHLYDFSFIEYQRT